MEDLETIIEQSGVEDSSPAWKAAPTSWTAQQYGQQAPAPMAYAAVTVIVCLCFLRPFEWVSAVYAFHVAYLLGVLSLFAISLFISSGQRAELSPELKVLLLFAGQLCLATPFAHWRGGAFDTIFHSVTIIGLMSLAVGLSVNSFDRLKGVIRVEAISTLVLTVVTLIAGVRDSQGRLMGIGFTFGNSNDLASILTVNVPFSLMFLLITRRVVFKLFWACSAAIMIYAIKGTMSRAGLISLALGVLVCLWNLYFKERRRGALLLLVLVVISVIAMLASSPTFRERFSGISGYSSDMTGIAASAAGSSLSRQRLFLRAIKVMLHHPLLGVGPGNFLAISGGEYGDWHVSHDTYTQCGAEAGVPALLMFVIMLRTAVRHCKRLQKRAEVSAEVKALAIAMRSSLLAYAVAALFADTAYQFFPYFLIVAAGALWQIEAAQPSTVLEQKDGWIDETSMQEAAV